MSQGTSKAFYYNFLPSKSEEEVCKLRNKPWKPTRYVIELREMVPNPGPVEDPWVIKKVISDQHILCGTLNLSNLDTFSHVFRYWPVDLVNAVALGLARAPVGMWNYTDGDHPKLYSGPNTYLQKGGDEYTYLLKWAEMAVEPWLDPGDELGLYWDTELNAFRVKVL